jgi:catechol 2,3-dioxygenase-like lactoylglutathione lyase family enzyme
MADTFFHIGVVVDDLPKAIAKYSRVLGLTFTEPAHVHVPCLEDPNPHEHVVYVAFSKDGPPYYELIEASGDGIFSQRFVDQILYLGMWETDMAARIEALKAEGIGLEARFKTAEDAVPFCVITEPGSLGIRLEYVDYATHDGIEGWIRTGKAPEF